MRRNGRRANAAGPPIAERGPAGGQGARGNGGPPSHLVGKRVPSSRHSANPAVRPGAPRVPPGPLTQPFVLLPSARPRPRAPPPAVPDERVRGVESHGQRRGGGRRVPVVKVPLRLLRTGRGHTKRGHERRAERESRILAREPVRVSVKCTKTANERTNVRHRNVAVVTRGGSGRRICAVLRPKEGRAHAWMAERTRLAASARSCLRDERGGASCGLSSGKHQRRKITKTRIPTNMAHRWPKQSETAPAQCNSAIGRDTKIYGRESERRASSRAAAARAVRRASAAAASRARSASLSSDSSDSGGYGGGGRWPDSQVSSPAEHTCGSESPPSERGGVVAADASAPLSAAHSPALAVTVVYSPCGEKGKQRRMQGNVAGCGGAIWSF